MTLPELSLVSDCVSERESVGISEADPAVVECDNDVDSVASTEGELSETLGVLVAVGENDTELDADARSTETLDDGDRDTLASPVKEPHVRDNVC